LYFFEKSGIIVNGLFRRKSEALTRNGDVLTVKDKLWKNTTVYLVAAALLVVSACVIFLRSKTNTADEGSFFAMGTYVFVTAYKNDCTAEVKSTVEKCESEISHRIESSYIARLNDKKALALPDYLSDILDMSLELCEATDGKYTACILPLTSLWNFDADKKTIPEASALEEALVRMDECFLACNDGLWTGMGIDLGSVGKGAACDAAAEVFKKNGASGVIAVGGSLALVGDKNKKAWTVAVRDPFSDSASSVFLTLSLGECFVSTSGSYEKCFIENQKLYHHILDSKTGMPAESELVSVTVITDSGALSDALSTAFFLVGKERSLTLAAQYGAQVVFVYADKTVIATEGLSGKITSQSGTEITYEAVG